MEVERSPFIVQLKKINEIVINPANYGEQVPTNVFDLIFTHNFNYRFFFAFFRTKPKSNKINLSFNKIVLSTSIGRFSKRAETCTNWDSAWSCGRARLLQLDLLKSASHGI